MFDICRFVCKFMDISYPVTWTHTYVI